ncbi:MAG: RNA 2',3'-cyclic phosphodiesterase, partial [Desulfobulbaceae bacterium]|nr:RNA 2',3'-cyclic phosphodiesterase [Desulfobulbaceae bacterium]
MPRLFVAIDFPEHIKDRLSSISCGLPGARWVPPEHLHLTLRFIGEVDSGLMPDIRESLAQVLAAPFSMQLQGVGFFPPRKKPRVVWVGVEKNEHLLQLRNRIESQLVHIGLEPEGRKFAPHITLARLKNTPASRVGRFLETHGLFITGEFPVDSFQLYSSVLNSKGAKHFV